MSGFKKASKEQQKLRLAITGVSGSGKTYTALSIATHLNCGKIALIDTEHGSASLYGDLFDFDTKELSSFSPQQYENALHEAESGEYGVVIIDSLSHAWAGKDGVLEIVDKATAKSASKNSYQAWGEGTKKQNEFIETLLSSPCHLIVTMRSKMAYDIQEKNGKKVPVKLSLAPIQREGVEYEFTIVGDLDISHTMKISKTRCSLIPEEAEYEKPGKEFAKLLINWLSEGKPADPQQEILNQIVASLKSLVSEFGEKGRADGILILKKVYECEWKELINLDENTLKSKLSDFRTEIQEYKESYR